MPEFDESRQDRGGGLGGAAVIRQVPLSEIRRRVTATLGDDLLRQMLRVLDNKQDQSIFVDLLRRGLAPGGAP